MANPLSLILGQGSKLKIVKIDKSALDIDVSLSESHEMQSDITMNPVEAGADVTDHIQPKPLALTIEGIQSDTPLQFFGGFQSLLDLVPGNESRSQQAFSFFEKLRINRAMVTVNTGLRSYDNMVLESLTVPRDSKTGQAFRFTAKFKEIRVVTAQVVSLAGPAILQQKTDTGQQTTQAAGSKVVSDNQTLLKKLLSFFTGGG